MNLHDQGQLEADRLALKVLLDLRDSFTYSELRFLSSATGFCAVGERIKLSAVYNRMGRMDAEDRDEAVEGLKSKGVIKMHIGQGRRGPSFTLMSIADDSVRALFKN